MTIRALSRIGKFIFEDCQMKFYDSFFLSNYIAVLCGAFLPTAVNWKLKKSTKELLLELFEIIMHHKNLNHYLKKTGEHFSVCPNQHDSYWNVQI